MVRQAVPLQPMEDHGGADLHLQPVEGPHAGAGGGALKGASACGERTLEQVLQQDLQPVEKSPCRNRFIPKDCSPRRKPMLQQFTNNSSMWEGPPLEQFMKHRIPREGPHVEAGKEREEQGAAERSCYVLPAIPIPRSPMPCGGRAGRWNEGRTLNLGRKGDGKMV